MKALLDTHAFLWWLSDDPRLGNAARELIADHRNEVFLSVASTWELAIKASIGKLHLQMPLEDLLQSAKHDLGLRILHIELAHALAVQNLAFHHRDPFDRLLLAQARVNGLSILSRDAIFDLYEIPRIW